MSTTPATTILYPKPWELAVWANQHRYPTNPRLPLLKSSEIVSDDLFVTKEELEALDEKAVVEPYTGEFAAPTTTDFINFPSSSTTTTLPPPLLSFPPKMHPPANTVARVRYSHSNNDDDDDALIPQHGGVRRLVRRCRVDPPASVKPFLPELVVRHESWIDAPRRQLTIITTNETCAHTATVGDVTVYKALSPEELLHWMAEGLQVIGSPSDKTGGKEEGCLFRQYAYFQVSPSLKIPFRSFIEKSLLKTYQQTSGEARLLDLEFMALRENTI